MYQVETRRVIANQYCLVAHQNERKWQYALEMWILEYGAIDCLNKNSQQFSNESYEDTGKQP